MPAPPCASMLALPLLPGGRFRCWWPEVIPAFWSLRPKPFTSTVKALRITTAHSPTSKRAGLPSDFFGMPAPTVFSRLSRALPRRTRDTSSHAARFDVGPRYFPGVVRVQRLRPLRLRVAPWLHRPGRVFRLPAAGLYFANIEAHAGTAVPQTFKQAEGSYACPSMRFDVGPPALTRREV